MTAKDAFRTWVCGHLVGSIGAAAIAFALALVKDAESARGWALLGLVITLATMVELVFAVGAGVLPPPFSGKESE